MMIGGEPAGGQAPRSDLRDAGARRRATSPRTPGREKVGGTAEQGYLHCGPNGAGPLRQDGPQRHRVRPHGRLRRGAGHPARTPTSASETHAVDAETTPLRDPEHYQYDLNLRDIAEVWRRGSVIASWLLDLTAAALAQGSRRSTDSRAGCPTPARGAGRSRRPSTRRCRCRSSPRRSTSASARAARRTSPDKLLSAMRFQFGGHLEKAPATRDRERTMSDIHSDALVFFGATGDLAYKKIFPALQAMVKRGHLDVPVIGVAKAGWTLDQLRARAQDSLEKHGGLDPAAFDKLCGLLRYVDGDYKDPATFQAIRKELGAAQRPAHYLAIPPVLFGTGRGAARQGRAAPRAPASSSRSRSAATSPRRRSSTGSCSEPSTRRRSSASTTTSASGRCTTCSSSASRTRSWSRSGTATTSRACRSPWRRTSASRAAARSTTRPAPSATWSRITCSRSWRNLAMEPPVRTDSESIRDEKVKVLKAIPPLERGERRPRAVPRLPERERAWRRTRRWRPSPRCGSRSTPGAGRGCRSTSAPGSACR